MDGPETQPALVVETASAGGDGNGAGPAESGGTAVEACVLRVAAGLPAARYGMFEAVSVSPEGATLAGGLLLEVSEEVTFELRMPDRTLFRARARVVEIVRGRPPAMKVVWTGVAEGDRHRLAR